MGAASQKPQHQVVALRYAESRNVDLTYVRDVDQFFSYVAPGYYLPIPPEEIYEDLWRRFQEWYPGFPVAEGIISDIYWQLRYATTRRLASMEGPYTCFKDCLLDTRTLQPTAHDPSLVATHYIPYTLDQVKTGSTDAWKFYLYSTFVDPVTRKADLDLINFIQEMLGYLLLDTIAPEKAFFLIGTGANGKSRLLEVMRAMVGKHFTIAMTLETLTTNRFAVQHLIGKRLNLVAEDESKYIRSDKFKAMVTGDLIQAERKFGENFEFSPRCKFVFSSNKLPTFEALDYAIERRLCFVPFNVRFTEATRDLHMGPKIMAELPGIIGWALEGARRLIAQDYVFTVVPQMQAVMDDFKTETSPIALYWAETWEPSETAVTTSQILYTDYARWCSDNGRKAMNSLNFSKEVTRVTGTTATALRQPDGTVAKSRKIRKKVEMLPGDVLVESAFANTITPPL